jgi:hypothetical protein
MLNQQCMHKQRIGGGRRQRTPPRPLDRRSWCPKDVQTVVQIADPRNLCLTRRTSRGTVAGDDRASRGR